MEKLQIISIDKPIFNQNESGGILHKSQNKIFVNCTETVNIFRMLRSAQTNVLARSVIPQELRGRLTHETQFTKLPFAKVRAHIFA